MRKRDKRHFVRGCFGGGGRTDGFSLLELLVALAIMVVLLGLMFQVVVAVLNPWSREVDRLTAASQAGVALDVMALDLQALFHGSPGLGAANLIVAGEYSGPRRELFRLLKLEANGELRAVVYWLENHDPMPRRDPTGLPNLFRADLSPAETWAEGLAGGPDWLEQLPPERFLEGVDRQHAILAVDVIQFSVEVLSRPSESLELIPATRTEPIALDLGIQVISARGAAAWAEKGGEGEVTSGGRIELIEQFGHWFHRRVRLP